MFVAATVAIMAAAAVPQLTAGVERTRAASAARYLAGRLAFARALVAPPVRVADVFPHVVVSLSDPSETQAPETSALLSFTPVGTASSRTLYVRGRDGSQYAVRVLGATGRTRVLRYAPATRTWIEVL